MTEGKEGVDGDKAEARGFLTRKRRGGKSFWDRMGLLIVPLTLAPAGCLLADFQERRQNGIAETRAAAEVGLQGTIEAERAED